MNLKLEGSVVLDRDSVIEKLRKYSENFVFEYYDKFSGTHQDEITPADICITVAINSRVGWNAVHSLMQYKESINKVLKQIPHNASLIDHFNDPELKTKVFNLFEKSCVDYVEISTASKILHKKRPSLIPIMDKIIENHYKNILHKMGKCFPSSSQEEKAIIIMQHFRNDLIQNAEILKSIIAKKNLSHITPLRLLEALIWQLHKSENGANVIGCLSCR